MLIRQFPDIHWLRHQAKTNFADRKVLGNQVLPYSGWPNVVLNTRSTGAERTGIVSPFSIFLNVEGQSHVKVAGKEVILSEDNYCIVNPGEEYSLIIPEGQATETFNIHIGEAIQHEVSGFMNSERSKLLDNPFDSVYEAQNLPLKSNWKEPFIQEQLNRLMAYYAGQNAVPLEDDREYELLSELVVLLTRQSSSNQLESNRLESLKRSTRLELVNRIQMAIDFMQVNYRETVNLDVLGQVCYLSKYHFLRTFKEVCQCTPTQYMARLRLKKATELLQQTDQPVAEIATYLGFSETASFSRFFRQMSGFSPKHYRKVN